MLLRIDLGGGPADGLCRDPLGVCQPEAPCTSPRVLIVRRLAALSSFQTVTSFFFAFLSPGTFGDLGLVQRGVSAGSLRRRLNA